MSEALNYPLNRKLRMGLIGGGGNAFIGRVHAIAATLDNRAEVVAGALSSDPDKARASAPAFGIAKERAYGSYQELIQAEAALPPDRRIDFVAVATPNHTHFEIAREALAAGLHVVCDKPMTTRWADAQELVRLVDESGRVFALTHVYSGYPLIQQAREMIAAGDLGEINAVRVQYTQGWLCGLQPGTTPPRGAWKSDSAKAGSGSLGDIGTHGLHLACHVTGLQPQEVSAVLRNYHASRRLDDYGHVLLDFGDDRLGSITFSQMTYGKLNDLVLEVDGSRASLTWRQEEPNQLLVRRTGQAMQVYERHPTAAHMTEGSRHASRLPGGHPEGFFEAFANLYRAAFDDMARRNRGETTDVRPTTYPNVWDGLLGVAFVIACQASNEQRGAWIPLDRPVDAPQPPH